MSISWQLWLSMGVWIVKLWSLLNAIQELMIVHVEFSAATIRKYIKYDHRDISVNNVS